MRKRYVLGFCFSDSLTDVALIRKERPAWQSKCLNGIGGNIEPDETETAAMEREFFEETGVKIKAGDWIQFCEMSGKGWFVYCFAIRSTLSIVRVRTMTDEQVRIVEWSKNEEPIIPNLNWLVPLAIESLTNPIESSIYYKD